MWFSLCGLVVRFFCEVLALGLERGPRGNVVRVSGLQKWSKGKQKEKVNNMVLFDQATYDKLLSEVPKFKLVTPSVLSDRLRVSFPVENIWLRGCETGCSCGWKGAPP
jgi:hypothetical protein